MNELAYTQPQALRQPCPANATATTQGSNQSLLMVGVSRAVFLDMAGMTALAEVLVELQRPVAPWQALEKPLATRRGC